MYLLLEFAGENGELEIPDPMNLDQKEYQKITEKIEEGVKKALKKIIEINSE